MIRHSIHHYEKDGLIYSLFLIEDVVQMVTAVIKTPATYLMSPGPLTVDVKIANLLNTSLAADGSDVVKVKVSILSYNIQYGKQY